MACYFPFNLHETRDSEAYTVLSLPLSVALSLQANYTD
jgi:hypothetical protein